MRRTWVHPLYTLCVCVGLWGFCPVTAYAQSGEHCNALLKQGSFDLAGPCFLRQAQQMKPGNQLSKLNKKRKALFLDKASYSFREAAKKEKRLAKRAYLREQALAPLQQILQEKLCLRAFRCRLIQGTLAEITRSVGYAQLTLVLQIKTRVQVSLRGYRYRRQLTLTQTRTLRLRPGTYQMTYQPTGKKPEIQQIALSPGGSQVFTVARLETPPISKVGPWVLIGVGIAATVASAVMLGVGYNDLGTASSLAIQQNEDRKQSNLLNTMRSIATASGHTNPLEFLFFLTSPDKSKEREPYTQELNVIFQGWSNASTEIDARNGRGKILVATGWSLAGVGIAAALAGVIWLATLPSRAPVKTAQDGYTGQASGLPTPPAPGPAFTLWQNHPHH